MHCNTYWLVTHQMIHPDQTGVESSISIHWWLTDDDVEDGGVAEDGGEDHDGEESVPEVNQTRTHVFMTLVWWTFYCCLQQIRMILGCNAMETFLFSSEAVCKVLSYVSQSSNFLSRFSPMELLWRTELFGSWDALKHKMLELKM